MAAYLTERKKSAGDLWQRRLGKSEAVFQMMDDVQSNNFAVIAGLARKLVQEEIESALRREIEKSPILSAKIITRKRRYYFRLPAAFPMVRCHRIGLQEGELFDLIAKNLSLPFPLGEAPLYRLILAETPLRQYLIGVFSHSAGDALAAFQALKNILLLTSAEGRGEPRPDREIRPLSPSLRQAVDSSLWPLPKLIDFAVGKVRALWRHASSGSPKHIPQFALSAERDKNDLGLLAAELQGECYQRFLTICKSRQVTVTAVLVSLLFQSLTRRWPDSRVRNMAITIAVDLRRRLPPASRVDQFGLYMGPMTLSAKISPGDTSWKIAESVARDMQAAIKSNEHLFFELLPGWLMKSSTEMAKTMGPPLPGPLLSNVGKVFSREDEERLSGLVRELFFAISPRRSMTFGLSASSYGNKLKILLSYNRSSIAEELGKAILADIDDGLHRLAGK